MIREAREEFIGVIDVWELRQLRWPFTRLLAPHFVEERELGRYVRELLASGAWSTLRVVPRPDAKHPHVFAIYGQRQSSPAAADCASEDRSAS